MLAPLKDHTTARYSSYPSSLIENGTAANTALKRYCCLIQLDLVLVMFARLLGALKLSFESVGKQFDRFFLDTQR